MTRPRSERAGLIGGRRREGGTGRGEGHIFICTDFISKFLHYILALKNFTSYFYQYILFNRMEIELQSEIKVHSENNSPFVVVTDLERTIEISHWGNIAVEEFIKIVHKGAELTVSIIYHLCC